MDELLETFRNKSPMPREGGKPGAARLPLLLLGLVTRLTATAPQKYPAAQSVPSGT